MARDAVRRLAVGCGYAGLVGAVWGGAWTAQFRWRSSRTLDTPLEFAATWLSESVAGAALFAGLALVFGLTLGSFLASRAKVRRFREAWGHGPRAVDTAPVIGLAVLGGAVLLSLPPLLDRWAVAAPGREVLRLGSAAMFALVVLVGFGRAFRRDDVGEGRGPRLLLASPFILLVTLVATSFAPRPDGGEGVAAVGARPNVLLITVDGMPADTLPRAAAALARRGVRFEQAVTPFPAHLPAAAALLTGYHPLSLGIGGERYRIPRNAETLAEVLAADGYSTAAFISSIAYLNETGLARGFALYDDSIADGPAQALRIPSARLSRRLIGAPVEALAQRPDEVVAERFDRWLKVHSRETFFCWLQLSGPDRPHERRAVPDRPDPVAGAAGDHRSEVEAADAVIEGLLNRLRKLDLYERTVVVITAPFALAPESVHDTGIGEETVRVPMVLAGPGLPRRDVTAQVRLQDLFPTLVRLTGRRMTQGLGDGKDLTDLLGDPEAASLQALITASDGAGGHHAALRMPTWRFTRLADGTESLLRLGDLDGPPVEVSAEYPDEVAAARTGLAAQLKGALPDYPPPDFAFFERDRALRVLWSGP